MRDAVVRTARRLLPLLPLLFTLLLAWPGVARGQVVSGSYIGDGSAGRRITGIGFQPDFVIVKADASENTVMRTSTMGGNVSKEANSSAAIASLPNRIQSMNADGFTVGSDNTVNGRVGTTYYWTAFKANANVVVGQYTGNGAAAQAIPVPFSPDFVIVLPAQTRVPLHRTNLGGTAAMRFGSTGNPVTDAITALGAASFTVGNSATSTNSQNVNGETYHYMAWNAVAGQMAVGTYDGDGTDNRNITGLGFRPGLVIVSSTTFALSPHQRSTEMRGDISFNFGSGSTSDMIQSILADGFQVGTHYDVNGNTAGVCASTLPCTYTWAAFAAPTVDYRSIGTNSGTLHSTGTATVALGSSVVTFAGGACLPGNVGLGDKLTVGAETLYILSRESRSRVIVQGAATAAHTAAAYTITRAFGGAGALQAWETAQGGDLAAGNRVEVGVAYNDGPFTAGLTIDGNTTDATHYMKLTVEPFQRHTGTAGTGVVLDGGNAGSNGITVQDDYTVVEWFELIRHRGNNGAASVYVGSATGVLLQNLLVHDFDDASFTVVGIKANANSAFTVRSSFFWDGGGSGQPAAIRGTNAPNTVTVQNCSIYGMTGRGVFADAGTFNVTNTIAVGSTVQDFDVAAGTQSYNLSSDSSATGTGSLTGRSATGQFVSTTAGYEDLHLRPASDAVDKGTDLSLVFGEDVDGDGRPGISAGWDIGADEKTTTVYRSIGMTAGTIYGTGTATNSAGSVKVDFAGATLPANVGQGDALTFTSGTAETLYILSRDSTTRVTVQAPAVTAHAGATYTIVRAFSGATALQDWETARQGNLVASNRSEVGAVYKDAPFLYNLGSSPAAVVIEGSNTSPQCHVTLTVPKSQRHNGVAGAGVYLDGQGLSKFGVNATDNYTLVEWLELRNFHGAGLAGAVAALGAGRKVLFNGLLIHDFYDGTDAATGARVLVGNPIPVSFTVRNCILYDGDQGGIVNGDCDSNVTVLNSTIYNMHSSGRGIYADVGPVTAANTIAIGNTNGDFRSSSGTLTVNTSLSSDGSAGTPTSTAAAEFVNAAVGDLHLRSGALAIDTGTNLLTTARFADDIDGQGRPGGSGWDKGADEINGVVTTLVGLQSFEARGADGAVDLAWSTASELGNLGFHLYRALAREGPFERVTASLIPGLGWSPTGQSYAYHDPGLANGAIYFYELEDIDASGAATRHGPVWATPSPEPGGTQGGGGGTGEAGPTGGSGAAPPGEGSASSRIPYGSPEPTSIRVVSRDERGTELELITPGFFATPEADGAVRLEIPGAELATPAGAPGVPLRHTWIEAVAGRQVVLGGVTEAEVVAFPDLRPVATPALDMAVDRAGTVTPTARPSAEGPAFGGLYPARAARVASVGFQRETKKALLELSPLRWDGGSRRLLLARRLRVHVLFTGVDPGEVTEGGARGRRLTRYRQLNPVLFQLLAQSRGLHGVRFEDVPLRGSRPLATRTVCLSRRGLAVAFHVEPDPSVFGPGSTLYFTSEGAASNLDGGPAVYELSIGPGSLAMPVGFAVPEGAPTSSYEAQGAWEVNRTYQPGLTEAQDLWFWDLLVSPVVKSYSFTLGTVGAGAETGHLRVLVQGGSDFGVDPDHHVRAFVNDVPVAEGRWDGKRPFTLEGEIPAGVLHEGANRLELENAADTAAAYSMVFLDRFEVRYPRPLVAEAGVLEGAWTESGLATVSGLGVGTVLLDVSFSVPRWLRGGLASTAGFVFQAESGHRYLAVSAQSVRRPEIRKTMATDLRARTSQADYVLIAPRAFLGAAEDLVDLRQRQGLTARAVALEEIVQEFGHGEARADAIREFLRYAFHSWSQPSPRYVLLLGDASYDPSDFLHTGRKDWVPSPSIRTSYLWTASDPAYAQVNGEDVLPDLAIGRLPAQSVEEARIMIDKVLAFEQDPGSLAGPAAIVADNPDGGGTFEADAEAIAALLGGREIDRIYLSSLGGATRGAIRDTLDRGPSLVSYIGHGGVAVWASENVWNNTDVPTLAPSSRYPLLFTMNCLNGYFHDPSHNSLAEQFLKAEGKGAVAAFSPTGLALDEAAHVYHELLIGQIVSGTHERLGDALLAAQSDYAATGAMPELLSVHHLLGDPAMMLR
jgi:hypothetical protein